MSEEPLPSAVRRLPSAVAKLRGHRGVLAVYVVLGLALWPVPLLGLVHAEASAVVAAVAFFASGLAALGAFREKNAPSFGRVLGAQEALLTVPLLLLTATLLWRPNCDYLRGLVLYLAMPPVTVAFAVGLAYGLSGLVSRYCKLLLIFIGLGVALGGVIYDLGFHPQFYTYNHVFGGVLGPIYDRDLALRPGFFIFRALTLLWALFFFLTGRWLRGRRQPGAAREQRRTKGRGSRIEGREKHVERTAIFHPLSLIFSNARAYLLAAVATALLIGAAYAHAPRLGFNTPAWLIQQRLGRHLRTAHFDLYYDAEATSKAEVSFLAEDQEWQYRRLARRLGTAPRERIASYLYPDAATKGRLTGARRTSVTPVWLGRPQVHLLQSAYQSSFGHELVHAFSRSFGLPVLKASRSVGLVEGLAVAFEPPGGRPSPADQVSAASLLAVGDRHASSPAEGVAARLSPLGFWAGRGAVSYTTMGAFVHFLAARYGTKKLRAVYAWADFEDVYGKPVRALADEWEASLMEQPSVARSAGLLAERRFSRPSLFEVACPHYVPPYRRAFRTGRRALAHGDTTAALTAFRQSVEQQPAFEAARVALARLLLARRLLARPGEAGGPTAARTLRLLRAAPDSVHGSAFFVTRADAEALRGASALARRSYERALRRLLPYRHAARALVSLRRALADRPALLRALVQAGKPLQKARRLRAAQQRGGAAAPAASVLRAVLLAEGERFARAARLLEDGSSAVEAMSKSASSAPSAPVASASLQALHRRRLAWLAQWWHRAGHARRAQSYARRAARAYRRHGDRDAAARWEAFAAKMEWVAER